MTISGEESCTDIEAGHHRPSAAGEGDRSWHSTHNSNCNNGSPGASSNEIDGGGVEEACRESCISDCSSSEVESECGTPETKVNLDRSENGDCRICHLSLEFRDSGVLIVLGCSCKNDLATVHKQCAETWFKIKGNKKCKICGSIAMNVVNSGDPDHSNEMDSVIVVTCAHIQLKPGSFWQGHRYLSCLLACMIFAFAISWLFHFNVTG